MLCALKLFALQDASGGFETVGCASEGDAACIVGGLHEDLGVAVEGGNGEGLAIELVGMVGTMPRGVAIAYSEDAGWSLQTDLDGVAGIGHEAVFLVVKTDADNCHVAIVGSEGRAVGSELDACCFACGFELLRE